MAKNTTFTSLKTEIANYIERGQSLSNDETAFLQIPKIINDAERDIIQRLKLLGTLEVLVDPTGLAIGSAVLTKPDRWRQTVSMSYGTGAGNNTRVPLFPRSLEYCESYWPDTTATDATQLPEFYAEYDLQHWLIAPTPPATYPLRAICYMQPLLLDDANQSNFWTTYTPNALRYGCLKMMAEFTKDYANIATWGQNYADQIATLDAQDLQRIMDRNTQRTRP